MTDNISTNPYKGVRDFYPKEWMLHKWMFWHMAQTCERFGYEHYNASVLEPSDLYAAKSGEEIVTNETYNLTDRGGRSVTLRPEMTPTVARMVAAQHKELPRPIRWYSIPNLFRYERPQRGRLREHFQLNVDIFGVDSIDADIEIISIGAEIMRNFGASPDQYSILINNRKLIHAVIEQFTTDSDTIHALCKLIDKKNKITAAEFSTAIAEHLQEQTAEFIDILETDYSKSVAIPSMFPPTAWAEIQQIIDTLHAQGYPNVTFDITLMRGFDYYTDTIFEFFDTHPDNNRSMFGGGRYNDLLDIFGLEKIPAVGFGMGDVTAYNFLEAHGLLPTTESATIVAVLPLSVSDTEHARGIAQQLREAGINCEFDFTDRKLEKKLKSVSKKNIPYVVMIGEQEISSGTYTVRAMSDGTQQQQSIDAIIQTLSLIIPH